MATKNTRLIYNDEKNLMVYDSLQPEDFKEFMMAYLTYKPGDDMSEYFSNPYVYALFLQYTDKIDYNEAKWANKAKANAENGKKGGRPKKNAEIEPNKDFDEEKPVDVPQEPSIAPEQPKNDYIDTSNYREKTWDIYEPNEDAFKTLYIKLKEHPSNESREEAKKEIRDIILMYGFDDENEYTNVKSEINSLLREWYVKNYNAA